MHCQNQHEIHFITCQEFKSWRVYFVYSLIILSLFSGSSNVFMLFKLFGCPWFFLSAWLVQESSRQLCLKNTTSEKFLLLIKFMREEPSYCSQFQGSFKDVFELFTFWAYRVFLQDGMLQLSIGHYVVSACYYQSVS